MSDLPLCNCGHTHAMHTSLAGCLDAADRGWCDCNAYVPATPDISEPTPTRTETLAQGRAARDEGIAQAGTGAPGVLVEAWRAKAQEALEDMAEKGLTFSADDVVAEAGLPPVPNMMGGLFVAAWRAGVIVPAGFSQATRAASHARVQRLWRAPDGIEAPSAATGAALKLTAGERAAVDEFRHAVQDMEDSDHAGVSLIRSLALDLRGALDALL